MSFGIAHIDATVAVLWAEEHERLARRAESIQVEQNVALAQERAERIRDPVLAIARYRRSPQVPIETAVAPPMAR